MVSTWTGYRPPRQGWIAWATLTPGGKWGRLALGICNWNVEEERGRGAWKGRSSPRGHAPNRQGRISRGCIVRGRLGMPTGSLSCQGDGLNAWRECRAPQGSAARVKQGRMRASIPCGQQAAQSGKLTHVAWGGRPGMLVWLLAKEMQSPLETGFRGGIFIHRRGLRPHYAEC